MDLVTLALANKNGGNNNGKFVVRFSKINNAYVADKTSEQIKEAAQKENCVALIPIEIDIVGGTKTVLIEAQLVSADTNYNITFATVLFQDEPLLITAACYEGSSDNWEISKIKLALKALSMPVVKVVFSVDYENKVLNWASHTPAEVAALVEGGTWVYGFDSTRGLYSLTHINLTESPTDVIFKGNFGDDSSLEVDGNGNWVYQWK